MSGRRVWHLLGLVRPCNVKPVTCRAWQIDSDDCETLDALDDADYLVLLAHDAVEVVVRHGASEATLMQAFVQATVAAAMLNSNQVTPVKDTSSCRVQF